MKRKGVLSLLVMGCLLAACGQTSSTSGPSTTVSKSTFPPASSVPLSYRPLVAILEQRIAGLRERSAGLAPTGHTVLGAEVLYANGNLGPSLLRPVALTNATLELDRFQELGIKGVMIEITFPFLLPSYANSAGYLSFYEGVVSAARARHMEVSVEENPIFPGLSSVASNYSGLTLQTYAAEQRTMAQIIIDDLHPNYLTILDETDTFAAHLRLPLDSPSAAVEVVNLELSGLQRGTTMVGAGTGTWEDPAIDAALLDQTSIDYLSIHVLPIDTQSVDNLVTIEKLARKAKKPTVIDETWLYKDATPGEAGLLNDNEVTSLNGFSFFAPLDQAFLEAITSFARTHGVSFLSPSWTGQFFAYLDWTTSLDQAPPASRRAQAAAVQQGAMENNQFSSTGRAYSRLAS
jgi:hypothetical protein